MFSSSIELDVNTYSSLYERPFVVCFTEIGGGKNPSLITLNKELRFSEQQFTSSHLQICNRYWDSLICFERHSSSFVIKSLESFSVASSSGTTNSATVGHPSMTISDRISDRTFPASI
jgi:hypothetical protein